MNAVGSSTNTYFDMVQQATRRNTLNHVAEARQSGASVDVEQVKSSNQQLRENSRELGVELYSQNLKKQQFETYVNNSPDNSNTSSSDDESNSVYTFDAARVNDNLQMVQKRTMGVALYENMNNQTQPQPEYSRASTMPVSVYV